MLTPSGVRSVIIASTSVLDAMKSEQVTSANLFQPSIRDEKLEREAESWLKVGRALKMMTSVQFSKLSVKTQMALLNYRFTGTFEMPESISKFISKK